MAEYVLLDKARPDEYYIRIYIDALDSDKDQLISSRVISISVIESIMGGSTYLNLKLIDGTGDLINNKLLIPSEVFNVAFGVNKESSTTAKFKLSSYDVDVINQGNMDQVVVSMTLISDKWEGLFKTSHNRSWNTKRFSEVATAIGEELELITDVEESFGRHTIIQPNWTNTQMLKWLTGNAINANQIGGYFYALTLDGKILFKTYDNLFSQKPKKEINHFNTKIDNNKEGFNLFSSKTNYMPTLNNGGFGLDYGYFDYDTKTFVEKSKTIEDIKERQLSDWYYIAKEHIGNGKYLYGGRNTSVDDVVQNRLLTSSNSVNKVEIYVSGNNDLVIGDVINLIVPTSNFKKQETIVNELYSGYWLVWKIAHLFDIEDDKYTTHLFLMRSGMNGLSIKGLVKTSTGKNLKK